MRLVKHWQCSKANGWHFETPQIFPATILDGRKRAIVIAEPLAKVIAAIRITSVHCGVHISLQSTRAWCS